MSDNHWETQPRKENGEFTFRYESRLLNNVFDKVIQKARNEKIKTFTKGGSYGFLREFTAGNKNYEIHHMPAASISPLSYWKGPCIIMKKEDHKKTSSYGRSSKSRKFRQWQAKLISEGRFTEAEYMDIKNIKRKFGDRYNKSINEKLNYERELIKKGAING